MKVFAIIVPGNEISEFGFNNLKRSSEEVGNDFEIQAYKASPQYVTSIMLERELMWNYPWNQPVRDFATGLLKTPYKTANKISRMSCAITHYELWKSCYTDNENYLILEHDAIWKKKLEDWVFDNEKFDIIGINDPSGATRKSSLFYELVQKKEDMIQRPPVIDEEHIPQGIAGNSAYIMKPSGAKKMLDLVAQFGLWPNDAIMCRQLVPTLGVTKTFFTGVQGLPSTTTL
jgi:hypothetical protein